MFKLTLIHVPDKQWNYIYYKLRLSCCVGFARGHQLKHLLESGLECVRN